MSTFLAAGAAGVIALGAASASPSQASAQPHAPAAKMVGGTLQYGACDSVIALSDTQQGGWSCYGANGTDLPAMAAAYRSGGISAARTVAAATAVSAAAGYIDPGLVNAQVDSYHWNYSADIYFGVTGSQGSGSRSAGSASTAFGH